MFWERLRGGHSSKYRLRAEGTLAYHSVLITLVGIVVDPVWTLAGHVNPVPHRLYYV